MCSLGITLPFSGATFRSLKRLPTPISHFSCTLRSNLNSVPIYGPCFWRCACGRSSPISVPVRYESSTALHPTVSRLTSNTQVSDLPSISSPSPVNIESFTLNEEVVKKDLEYLAKWNALANEMEIARQSKNYSKLLEEVQTGLLLLESIGHDNAPVQCQTQLCLEGAQACTQLKRFEDALQMVKKAEEGLTLTSPRNITNTKSDDVEANKDMIAFSECQLLYAHILILQQKGKEAEEVAQQTLSRLEGEGKGGEGTSPVSPIRAVAALHLKRTAMTTVGRALVSQARVLVENKKDEELCSRTLSGKALDILIDALNAHIEEKDHESVKMTLENIYFCFEGLQDWSQASTTCEKYIRWCRNRNDKEGEKHGEELLTALRERHPELEK